MSKYQEIWKDIKGFEGIYQVSNQGNVRRLHGRGCKQDRLLTPKANAVGYPMVSLLGKSFNVGQLVADAFLTGKFEGAKVAHLNENKMDCRAENLKYMTMKELINHGTRTERAAESHRRKIVCTMTGEVFDSAADVCAFIHVTKDALYKHLQGHTRTCGCHTWAYADEWEGQTR